MKFSLARATKKSCSSSPRVSDTLTGPPPAAGVKVPDDAVVVIVFIEADPQAFQAEGDG